MALAVINYQLKAKWPIVKFNVRAFQFKIILKFSINQANQKMSKRSHGVILNVM